MRDFADLIVDRTWNKLDSSKGQGKAGTLSEAETFVQEVLVESFSQHDNPTMVRMIAKRMFEIMSQSIVILKTGSYAR